MAPIATLPVFLKLRGKTALVAGGSEPAVWKTELLLAAGARVEVYAADPCAALAALVEAAPGDTARLHRRAWEPADFADAAVAIGALAGAGEAAAFQAAARRAGVPVNVIDKPAFCDFQFGTVVSRSPLVIGISTDGAAPVFGQAIRTRIEAVLPRGLQAWAQAAKDWRPALQALDLGFHARRRFWEVFSRRAFADAQGAPDPAVLAECRAAALDRQERGGARRFVLVGAGPGEPDAVTLAAVGALQAADTVIHGPDLDPTLVDLARREARRTVLRPGDAAAEVARALAEPGQQVAWLDAGDPTLCLVWSARAAALAAANVEVGLVAGLGTCQTCTPACPAWESRKGSAASSLTSPAAEPDSR